MRPDGGYYIVKALLEAGANPCAADRKGQQPLHLVTKVLTAKLLLKWGACATAK